MNVSIKIKIVLDNLNGNKRVMEKGPFVAKFQKHLSTEDKYQCVMKILLDNNFCTHSVKVLEKEAKLGSFFINKLNGNKTKKKRGNCVIDYVL